MLRLLLLLALAPLAAAQPAGDLLIRGATVLTVTNGTLENTDVLVRNGRIAEIGQGLARQRGPRGRGRRATTSCPASSTRTLTSPCRP
jgi:hypothetical protein